MEIQLKRFDIREIKDDKVVVLIGKRDTGKSFLCKDILSHHTGIPAGQVISGTEAANSFYGKMVPKLFIYDEYEPGIIERLLKRQRMMIDRCKENPSTDPRAFLVLDDCLYDNSWTKDKNVRSLFMNGRHFKIMFMITMQYALGIPPNLRTNIDYVFILREPYLTNRKRIWENYASMFPTLEAFCAVMDQTTENYECLVINNNAKSNKLNDQIFWYKAENHPNFRLGSKEFWEISKNMGSDDEDEAYDPSKSKKKNATTINVKKTKW